MGNQSSSSSSSSSSILTSNALDKGAFSDESEKEHLLKNQILNQFEVSAIQNVFQEIIQESDLNYLAIQRKVQIVFQLPRSNGDTSPEELNFTQRLLNRVFLRHNQVPKKASNDVLGKKTTMTLELTEKFTLQQFIDAVGKCTRSSSTVMMQTLSSLFDVDGEGALSKEQLYSLVVICFQMSQQPVNDDKHDANEALNLGFAAAESKRKIFFQSLVEAMLDFHLAHDTNEKPQILTKTSIVNLMLWTSLSLPLLPTILKAWMSERLFNRVGNKVTYYAPKLSRSSDIFSREHLFCLSLCSPLLQSDWKRLYTSAEDGLSFNRLQYHLLGYRGPSILVCQDSTGAVFGVFCDTEWKESSTFYGGTGCFIFRLAPTFAIYRPKPSGPKNLMFLNSKGHSIPKGIGMGGNTQSLRLFLDEEFENCTSLSSCSSFDEGPIAGAKTFQICALEAWGCGGEDASLAQKSHRRETESLINKARKVDKAQFAGSEFDKEFMLSKTFGHGTNAARVVEDAS